MKKPAKKRVKIKKSGLRIKTLAHPYSVWEVTMPTSIDVLSWHVVARNEAEVMEVVKRKELTQPCHVFNKDPTYKTRIKQLFLWNGRGAGPYSAVYLVE
jgi:hypothetical protein